MNHLQHSLRLLSVVLTVLLAASTVVEAESTFTIESGISQTDVVIVPISTPESGADFYNFIDNAEMNPVATPPFALYDNVAHVYLHEDSRAADDNISLGVILEKPNQSVPRLSPPSGGAAQIVVAGLPAGTTIRLLDDELTDTGSISPSGTAQFVFEWGACCTDGFVLGNLPKHGWTIAVSWGPSLDIDQWQFLSGNPVDPVRHHLGLLTNTLFIRAQETPTCGDGEVTGSETCDDGNTVPGDRCDVFCQVEQFACSGPESVSCNDDGACPPGEVCQSTRCDSDVLSAGCDGLGPRCGSDLNCGTSGVCCGPVCGNGFVEPGERCDRGPANGTPGAGCTSQCELTGICTLSQTACATAIDCPPAEGCCRNGLLERDEQCDDGNSVDGDCCSQGCQVEPAEACVPLPEACAASFGPHLIDNPTFQQTKMQDRNRPADGLLDKWTSRGDFVLRDGQKIDPDTEPVEFVLNQTGARLYAPILMPSACPGGLCFLPRTNSITHVDARWQFTLRATVADVSDAPGWRKAKLSRVPTQPSKIGFSFSGAAGADIAKPGALPGIATEGGVRRVRQSLRIGDDCVTRALDCEQNATGSTFKCLPAHCGNGTIERGEQCGEVGLPSCGSGYGCDTCRCIKSPLP